MSEARRNIMVGLVMLASFMVYSFVLIYPRDFAPRTGRSISWFGIAGLLMPLGILSEVFFSVPPLLVLASGVAMVVFMAWFAVAVWRNIAAQGV